MAIIHSYRDLRVWQKAMDVVILIYRLTTDFPREEAYGLTSQLRRAAVSIPANIAEGRRRGTRKDFRQFIIIAYSSGAELETLLEISQRLLLGDQIEREKIKNLHQENMRMLNGLLTSLAPPPKKRRS